jgi:uncharacterized protein DUF1587
MLALEIDPSKFLPSDDSTRGFDNVAAALTLWPALLEGYTNAAAQRPSCVPSGDIALMKLLLEHGPTRKSTPPSVSRR